MWPYLRFKGRLVVFCSDQAELKVFSLSVRGETSWLTRVRETGLVIMCRCLCEMHFAAKKCPRHHCFPQEMTSEKRAQQFHTDVVSLLSLGAASDWLKYISLEAQPMRSATQIWLVCVISMGFLRSFLESHFAGIPVVASQNVGCFL